MQHVDIVVSIENPKYSPTKLGSIEKDIDAILNVSLNDSEGICERYLSALKFYRLTIWRCKPFSGSLRLELE